LIFAVISLPYLLTRINTLKNVFSSDGSLSYRRELNSHVLSLATNNYLGIGLDLTSYYIAKNFKTVDNQFVMFDQAPAHNILIQIFTETGIFAFLVFVFFIYYSLRHGLVKKNNSFALAGLAYFLAAQFHPVFTNHFELTAFFFLYLGLSLDEK
jgi:O-antigen ligase